MHSIECPKPAYDRLVAAGIDKRIIEKGKDISDIFLYRDIECMEQGRKVINWAEKFANQTNTRISERTEVARDILFMQQAVNEESGSLLLDDLSCLFLEHPSFLGRLVLGKNVLHYEKYGFPTRRSLEEAINSFCIGERETISDFDRGSVIWRRGNYKFSINQNMHGDLYASQTNVSGKEEVENTLFGDREVFDTVKHDVLNSAVHAHQDWGPFLAITLKYAEEIGQKNMKEITQWEDVLKETGVVGTNTAEAMFGRGGMDNTRFLMEQPILRENKTVDIMPLIMGYREFHWVPYVKDDMLNYLEKNVNGDLELTLPFCEKTERYSSVLTYAPEDLPKVLSAIYKLFARDRTDLTRIMNRFLGKIVEEE